MNIGDSVQLEGCRSRTRHLETSSGISAIDALLGGGLLNTCSVSLFEPSSRAYIPVILRCFLAEGALSLHSLFLAGPNSSKLLDELPTKVFTADKNEEPRASSSRDAMKIAWRYTATPKVNSAVGGDDHRFDLSSRLGKEEMDKCDIHIATKQGFTWSYKELWKELRTVLTHDAHSKKTKGTKKKLLRIVIAEVGSPLWLDPEHLGTFMVHLRGLLRDSYAVAMISVSSALTDPSRVEVDCDVAFQLLAVAEQERKQQDPNDRYHGYFRISRLPRVITLAPTAPPAVDLVFELLKKGLQVKILHLPPAIEGGGDKTSCGIDF